MHLEICNETFTRIINIYMPAMSPKLRTEPKIMSLS